MWSRVRRCLPSSKATTEFPAPTGSGFTPDGTGLTTGGNTGNGEVTISWTVEPGCDEEPDAEPTDAEPAAAVPVAAEPTFTG